VLSAAVLRHLLADPLLPSDLLTASWMGDELREHYERYDTAFKEVWRAWFKAQRAAEG
jgi:phenylacetic acid degradation operon negative regulatory protein